MEENTGLERKQTSHPGSFWWHPLLCSCTSLRGRDYLAITLNILPALVVLALSSLVTQFILWQDRPVKEVLLLKSFQSIKIIHFEQSLFILQHRNIIFINNTAKKMESSWFHLGEASAFDLTAVTKALLLPPLWNGTNDHTWPWGEKKKKKRLYVNKSEH